MTIASGLRVCFRAEGFNEASDELISGGAAREHLPEHRPTLIGAEVRRGRNVDGYHFVVDLAPDQRVGSESQFLHQ